MFRLSTHQHNTKRTPGKRYYGRDLFTVLLRSVSTIAGATVGGGIAVGCSGYLLATSEKKASTRTLNAIGLITGGTFLGATIGFAAPEVIGASRPVKVMTGLGVLGFLGGCVWYRSLTRDMEGKE